MKKHLGYSLMSIGLLGFFFFLSSAGTAFPLRELWSVLSVFLFFAGGYLFVKCQLQKPNNQSSYSTSDQSAQIEQLKRTGDKVRVTLDNAEVQSKSYQKEIISNGFPSGIEMLDALYDGNRNYKTREIQQTYIVYYKQYGSKPYKFVSQATTQNADALKRFIERQKGIDLYIDPKDPSRYYFDLPFI